MPATPRRSPGERRAPATRGVQGAMHGTLAALILLRPAGRRQAAPASPIRGIDTDAAPESDGRRRHALAITVKRDRFTVARAAAGYRDVRALTRDDAVTPAAFPDVAITPADVLG